MRKNELFNSKRRIYCRGKLNDSLKDDAIQPAVKHGGGLLMFCDCFGGSQTGHLFKINGIMNPHKYPQILVHHAMPAFFRTKEWYFSTTMIPSTPARFTRDTWRKKLLSWFLRWNFWIGLHNLQILTRCNYWGKNVIGSWKAENQIWHNWKQLSEMIGKTCQQRSW